MSASITQKYWDLTIQILSSKLISLIGIYQVSIVLIEISKTYYSD